MTAKTDICACPNCEHPRYGHPRRGQRWSESCPNCWSDGRHTEAHHDFDEPAGVSATPSIPGDAPVEGIER
jgi:hypothetical protein